MLHYHWPPSYPYIYAVRNKRGEARTWNIVIESWDMLIDHNFFKYHWGLRVVVFWKTNQSTLLTTQQWPNPQTNNLILHFDSLIPVNGVATDGKCLHIDYVYIAPFCTQIQPFTLEWQVQTSYPVKKMRNNDLTWWAGEIVSRSQNHISKMTRLVD